VTEDSAASSSQIRTVLQVVLIVAAIAAAIWTLHRMAAVVFVLIEAALFAYVIAPLVEWAERPIRLGAWRLRLPRVAAIVLVYVLLAGAVSAAAALLLPRAAQQIGDMMSRAPAYTQAFLAWEHGWFRYYERLRIPIQLRRSIDQSFIVAGKAGLEAARGSLLALARGLTDLPWLLLIPILAFFLLKDARVFRRDIVTALPHRLRLRGHRVLEDLNATLAAYVRAQLLACLLVGALSGFGFALLGIPYPVLLGVLAGMLEFIPLVGPLLLAVLASIVAALHTPVLALWVIAFLGVLRTVQDYVIYPRLIRRGLHLHPVAVIVAVLAGAELGGVAGMFLAVPTLGLVSVLVRHALAWRAEAVPSGTARAG
jgi:predicted PurR-regulated permease PerM